mmetsp:Transcript_10073/g.32844  ORF Transcript_10073/g.32844 Transcript_10073/m.32844 type:complete len:101 (-) Transcript_10073:86-388(-)
MRACGDDMNRLKHTTTFRAKDERRSEGRCSNKKGPWWHKTFSTKGKERKVFFFRLSFIPPAGPLGRGGAGRGFASLRRKEEERQGHCFSLLCRAPDQQRV